MITKQLACLCVFSFCLSSAMAQDPKPLWSSDTPFPLPESVYYNPVMNQLIVSQVNGGGPLAKDNDGCLSRYSLDGKLIEAKWITGMHAPKGSRAKGNLLWVSDIDRMHCIDTQMGKIISTIAIPGSKFLNDVAITDKGTVYVSDMTDDKIYQIKNGKAELFVEIGRPNGILIEGDQLLVAGRYPQQSQDGYMMSVDLKTKAIHPIAKMPTNTLDGFEANGQGGYFISDWDAGVIHHINAQQQITTILKPGKGSADIGFNPKTLQLLVPMMINQRIDAYDARIWLKK